MRVPKLTYVIAAAAVVFATSGSNPHAQTPAPKDMATLLATLREPGLPMARKGTLGRQAYSGQVEVLEVQEVSMYPAPDRSMDSLRLDKPSMRIMVDVGASNPNPIYLAFETTDVTRAKSLRKGDKVTITGKLVKFVQHREGYNGKPDEWLVFGDVVIAPSK